MTPTSAQTPTPPVPVPPPQVPGAGARRYLAPTEFCDLIMQGGIASGVVYPTAVLELAPMYRFRGIGGSSAGAIVAAAVAAAEHGRDADGFETLEQFCKDLGTEGKLLSLFQPERSTRPLFDLFCDYLGWKREGGDLGNWLANHFSALVGGAVKFALLIALLVVIGLTITRFLPDRYYADWWYAMPLWLNITVALCFALSLFAIAFAWRAWRLWSRLRRLLDGLKSNDFGMCTGLGTSDKMALTDYLASYLDRLAGLHEGQGPLTFGHLRKRRSDQPIDLLILTSDLSLRRPVRFPLEGEPLLFKETEWARLFPANVVEALKEAQPSDVPAPAPVGYFYLPMGDALPVIVAVRISLSFPLLFSAVPLYTLSDRFLQRLRTEQTAVPKVDELKRAVFSDGGIVSNFPIHLFDRWLPDCPTFGINLAELPAEAFDGEKPGPEVPVRGDYLSVVQPDKDGHTETNRRAVHLPKANEQVALEWYAVDGYLALLEGIFYTAKNHRDTLQSMLPSYRERIITIRLAPDEGGLNLTMPLAKIEALMRRGQEAGKMLRSFDFAHHRWVRFQVILAQLECELRQMAVALHSDDWWKKLDKSVTVAYPFPRDAKWCRQAVALVNEMLEMLESLSGVDVPFFSDGHEPMPSPVKRLVPPE